jgi:hypothetical protein
MRWISWSVAALAAASILGGPLRAGDEGRPSFPEKRAAEKRSIEDLVRDLASDDFKVREEATEALGERGEEAIPALERAAKDPDPEVRWRAEKALKAARARAERGAGRGGARAPERTTPERGEDGRDPFERLREAEEQLRRLHPDLDELLRGLRLQDKLPRAFGRILEEMQERLRDLDRPFSDRSPQREFWSFRYQNGRWEFERSPDPVEERLGVRTQPVSPLARAQLQLEDGPPGVAIEDIKAGSAAEKAGLERWDIVLEIDGKPVAGEADLEALARAGEHKVAIVRRGRRDTKTVIVEGAIAPDPEAEPAPPLEEPGGPRKY